MRARPSRALFWGQSYVGPTWTWGELALSKTPTTPQCIYCIQKCIQDVLLPLYVLACAHARACVCLSTRVCLHAYVEPGAIAGYLPHLLYTLVFETGLLGEHEVHQFGRAASPGLLYLPPQC